MNKQEKKFLIIDSLMIGGLFGGMFISIYYSKVPITIVFLFIFVYYFGRLRKVLSKNLKEEERLDKIKPPV